MRTSPAAPEMLQPIAILVMSATTSNVQMSQDEGLENSFRVCSIAANIAAVLLVDLQVRKVQGRRFQTRKRSVEDIYNELGPIYFRRACRMQYSTFKALADEHCPYIIGACGHKGGPKRFIPNSPISPDVRLACAIRWFSGGSAYDLMTTYGRSNGHSDTIRSYWHVVDAINSLPNFKIEYPKGHEDQRQIALGFQNISSAGFKRCAGAIQHGILMWMYSKADVWTSLPGSM